MKHSLLLINDDDDKSNYICKYMRQKNINLCQWYDVSDVNNLVPIEK